MSANEIIKDLRSLLPPQVDYAELVCAEGFSHGQHYVWTEPELYIISAAADCIESLQAEVDGMRSNWYKCAENYQQKCRDITELEAELEKSSGCVWCKDDSKVFHDGQHFHMFCSYCGKKLGVNHAPN